MSIDAAAVQRQSKLAANGGRRLMIDGVYYSEQQSEKQILAAVAAGRA